MECLASFSFAWSFFVNIMDYVHVIIGLVFSVNVSCFLFLFVFFCSCCTVFIETCYGYYCTFPFHLCKWSSNMIYSSFVVHSELKVLQCSVGSSVGEYCILYIESYVILLETNYDMAGLRVVTYYPMLSITVVNQVWHVITIPPIRCRGII